MTLFSVWAPKGRRVEIAVRGQRHDMQPHDGGWFHVDLPGAAHGDDYAFHIDGGPARPDPRSLWQPHGVHGPSRLFDHDRHVWSDAGWSCPRLGDVVIYEVHIGTFTADGTFDAAIEHLGDLAGLGIGAVELMPIAEFPGAWGWGYDGVDLYAAFSGYGGPEGLKRLVDAAHAHGLAVILDVVYNHLGPEGNYLGEFGPYFTDKYDTPWGMALNVDEAASHEVRAFIVANALTWLGAFHVDGLRLDAVHHIIDTSALSLMEELSTAIDAFEAEHDRRCWLTAESNLNDPRLTMSREVNGQGVDAAWNDDFHHALHARLTDERSGCYQDFGPTTDIVRALRDVYVYGGRYSAWQHRMRGRSAERLRGDQIIVSAQNHDQIGNRAMGERLTALVDPGSVLIAGAIVLLSPYVPLLFMGEEWAASTPFLYFAAPGDPRLRESIATGRMAEFADFGWDGADPPRPDDPVTFARSKLKWDERDLPGHAGVMAWYRDLIRLRRERNLGAGPREITADVLMGGDVLRIQRNDTAVVANLGDQVHEVAVPGVETVLLAAPGVVVGPGTVSLPAHSVAVLALCA